jgi:hypothetical protein
MVSLPDPKAGGTKLVKNVSYLFTNYKGLACQKILSFSSLKRTVYSGCFVLLFLSFRDDKNQMMIFNCNWVATRWQLFSTHIHTNNTVNVTKSSTKNTKIHRTTQKIHRATQQLRRVRAMPRLCGFYPAICLQLRKKHGKTSVRVAIHKHTVRIHSHNNKNT